jgi:hypothetical protein
MALVQVSSHSPGSCFPREHARAVPAGIFRTPKVYHFVIYEDNYGYPDLRSFPGGSFLPPAGYFFPTWGEAGGAAGIVSSGVACNILLRTCVDWLSQRNTGDNIYP